MTEPRRAALLLVCPDVRSAQQEDTFAAQHLACQLYAANHDMVIVGFYDTCCDPAELRRLLDDLGLVLAEPGTFDLVLAVAPDPDGGSSAQFEPVLERLRQDRFEVVLIDRREA